MRQTTPPDITSRARRLGRQLPWYGLGMVVSVWLASVELASGQSQSVIHRKAIVRSSWLLFLRRTLPSVSLLAAFLALSGDVAQGQAPARSESARPESVALRPGTVAVVPFANISGEPDDDWIGAGIAETVSADLQQFSELSVVGREALLDRLTGTGAAAMADESVARELARDLGIAWIVTGSFQRLGNQLRITARIVSVETGDALETAWVDGRLEDIFALQDQVGADLNAGFRDLTRRQPPRTVASEGLETPSREGRPTRSRDQGGSVADRGGSNRGGGGAFSSTPPPSLKTTASEGGAGTGTAAPPADAVTGGITITAVELVAQGSAKVANAVSVEEAPTLDGDVLWDPAWAEATPVSGFWQSAPDDGQPATERTEVRVVFTEDTIFFGVVCYDRDPTAIIMTDSRRDSTLRNSDSFQMVLDTFSDQQNGFVFGTSPAGQEYDGQVINEGGRSSNFGGGGGGGFSRGSAGGFNLNWDGAWQVRTTISDIGWSAEFAIPFRTIRYPAREDQSWGVNFERSIRRRNETAFWTPIPRQYNLYRVSMAGQLVGVRPPVGLTRNLQITPYVIGELVKLDESETGSTDALGDWGGDLKYSVTSGLTLDATYNTDFAQVEVDDQQINLDRFSLFFPEKRPFFLENAGVFTVNNSGASGRNYGQTELFFSRRIGISDAGEQIPILAGARLSGKVTDTVTVGFINMQTENVESGAPANNFTVARVRQDLPNRSSVGGLFVNRLSTGASALSSDYNRTYAVDGRWGIGQNGLVQGFVGRTQTPGYDGRDHAMSLAGTYNSEAWRINSGYQENGEDFNPEVGFLRRSGGFRKYDLGVNNRTRPEGFLKFQELTPHMSFSRFWTLDGIMESSYQHYHLMGQFEDSSTVGVNFDPRSEVVFEAFEVSGIPIPPGRYDFAETGYSFTFNRSAPINFGIRYNHGGFFGGNLRTIRPSLNARYGEIFNLSLSYSRNDINLPAGSTITNLTSVNVGYNFTTRLYVQSLLQHNDSADLWSVNFRLGWLQDANTGLFLVYNETEGIGDTLPSGAGRSLILKFSYLFDVLD